MKHRVRIEDTGIPDGAAGIVDQLPRPDSLEAGETVTLQFTHTFLYLTGLVLLASWRKSLPLDATFEGA